MEKLRTHPLHSVVSNLVPGGDFHIVLIISYKSSAHPVRLCKVKNALTKPDVVAWPKMRHLAWKSLPWADLAIYVDLVLGPLESTLW